jgi:hypothetical protein
VPVREWEAGVLVAGGERGGDDENGGNGKATAHRKLRDAVTRREGDGEM